jgi:DNA gyrase subunit A
MAEKEQTIGNVKLVEIGTEMRNAYLDYAMSVITARALPDVRDGLKPVQRRVLYTMGDIGLRHNVPYKKCARIVGDVLGRYHPHGDQAVYDALVRMAQDFTMRYPLIDGQGNFGSIDNDPPAAMRYTEARLTEIAEELLAEIERDTVDFSDNFDGTLKEPRVLPAKVPNLLLNGASGIAVGMATNIPPHNLNELVDAIQYLIENWEKVDDIEVDDLMKFVQGPDFPTAGIILGGDGIRQAYATGNGRIVVRGKIHTEEAGGGKTRIIITELPYQVNKASLIERIADLVRDRKIEDIGDLRDESDRQGMSIIVELKRGADPQPVINQLLKYTPLQTGFGINMLALVEGEPRVLSLKRMLQLYVQHRQDVITRRTKYDLEKAKARAHILEGLKIALDHLDEVIRTIRTSPDAEVAKDRLMKRFKLSDLQAQAILDMQLRRLAALERKKIEDELEEVRKTIKFLEDLLKHPKKILGVISDELSDLKKRFGDVRRTHISDSGTVELQTEFKAEDLVQEQSVLVSITQRGYISRVPLSSVRRTAGGSKSVQTREEDAVQYLFTANTRDTLLIFTNKGKAYPLRAHQAPDVERTPKGLPLNNFLSFEQNERVTSAVAVSDFSQAEFLAMATTQGRAKRTPLVEFDAIRSSGVAAINLSEGDELGWARLTHGDGELMFVTEQGQAMRCKEEEISVQGRTASGVAGIKLNEGDKVASMDVVQPDGFLLITTTQGFGKRTKIDEYSVQGRNTKGVSTLGRDPARAGVIAAARVVNEDDDVTIIATSGHVLRSRVANLPKSKRTSKETPVLKLKEGDAVASIARLESQKAESKRQKAEGKKQQAEGEAEQGQKPEGRKQKAESDAEVDTASTASPTNGNNGAKPKSK